MYHRYFLLGIPWYPSWSGHGGHGAGGGVHQPETGVAMSCTIHTSMIEI